MSNLGIMSAGVALCIKITLRGNLSIRNPNNNLVEVMMGIDGLKELIKLSTNETYEHSVLVERVRIDSVGPNGDPLVRELVPGDNFDNLVTSAKYVDRNFSKDLSSQAPPIKPERQEAPPIMILGSKTDDEFFLRYLANMFETRGLSFKYLLKNGTTTTTNMF